MKFLKDEKGLALPLVLVVVIVLTILGITIFMLNMTETKQVARSVDGMKAHYVARSGAHAVAAHLINNPGGDLEDLISDNPGSAEGWGEFGEGEFDVEVFRDADNDIIVKSTGTVGDVKKTVYVTVGGIGVDFPLFANTVGLQEDDFTKDVGAKIRGGNVYYTVEDLLSGFEEHGNNIVVDGRIIKDDFDFPDIILPCQDEESVFYQEFYDGNCFESLNDTAGNHDGSDISESSKYFKIKLSADLTIKSSNNSDLIILANEFDLHNNDLTIELDGNTIAIVAKDFDAGNNDIEIKGDGVLQFYVKNFDGRGNFDLDEYIAEDIIVNIFVLDDGKFELRGTPNFYGTIYGPNATFKQSGGGGGTIHGWIIVDEFEGGSSMELIHKAIEMPGVGIELKNYVIQRWRYVE